MRNKVLISRNRIVVAGIAVALSMYAASPYVALYRLGQALRAGDVDKVEAAVDWNQVRDRMKHDATADLRPAAATSDELPPFGASFISGIVGHEVDNLVTPEALCQDMQQASDTTTQPGASGSIDWAFFDSPTSFTAQVSPGSGPAIRLHMTLERTGWKVTAIDMPDENSSRRSRT
jgi:hypothetical protein